MLNPCLIIPRTAHISSKDKNLFPKPPLGCEKNPLESNPIPFPNIYTYQYHHF